MNNNSSSAAKKMMYAAHGNEDDILPFEAPSTPVQQEQLPDDDFNNNNISDSEVELTPTGSAVSSSSSEAAGAYSKKAMIQLMREQVEIVRNLTNAQLAQKKELEEVKAEKRRLEEERLANENDAKNYSRHNNSNNHNNNNHNRGVGRLNLPTRSTSDGKDSDNQSISTFSRFLAARSPPKPQRTTKYRHPDEAYYARDRAAAQRERARTYSSEMMTVTNCDPSLASTIMPTAIVIDPIKANTTGAFGSPHNNGGLLAPPQRFASPTHDKIEITKIPERNVIPPEELNNNTCLSKLWWFFSHLCTLFVPDIFLCCVGRKVASKVAKKEAKQAWREKVAIFVIMMLSSAAFIGVSGVVPMFLCRETEVFTMVSFIYLVFSLGVWSFV